MNLVSFGSTLGALAEAEEMLIAQDEISSKVFGRPARQEATTERPGTWPGIDLRLAQRLAQPEVIKCRIERFGEPAVVPWGDTKVKALLGHSCELYYGGAGPS